MSSTMEQVHGVDVSWMTQSSPKDRINRKPSPPSHHIKNAPSVPTSAENRTNGLAHGTTGSSAAANGIATGKRKSRANSVDKSNGQTASSPRRNSWFSNISAKFSHNSAQQAQSQQPATHQSDSAEGEEEEVYGDPAPLPPPSPTNQSRIPQAGSRNAVLQPAMKPEGNGPYTPAPPRGSQNGFLGVLRRLSSSSGGLGAGNKIGHGLVERRILNVDQNRQRCPISELHDAKLRKVSFCVDVEIAPMPKYVEEEASTKAPVETAQKKKLTEKGEGEALKHPHAAEEVKDAKESPPLTAETASGQSQKDTDNVIDESTPLPDTEKDTTRKKEKKKKSEEERKARKEKKRKLAEANGSVPMEIRYDSSDSSTDPPTGPTTLKTTSSPTINPVRIYRRCCQLRESPILKKITEQLTDATNASCETGLVNRLDLTGYYMQTGDLVTLGDYFAVVPVREVILEDCNLTDESLRVVLAGLLAARRPDAKRRKPKHELGQQGGVIERLVLKNSKLGPDGWKHLSLFLYLCRSLKYLDVSHIPFPQSETGQQKNGQVQPTRSVADIFSMALAGRLGGSSLELLNLGETEPTMAQLGTIMDGVIQCGVKRLGLAHNHLDEQGVEHLTRYLAAGKCEGLDLGGNDLRHHMEKIFSAVKDEDPLWALSLSGCNLKPASLCKIMPTLSKLPNFRFIDLSHNHELFTSTPSAVGLLRRYLPKIEPLKRIHLQDVGMTSEQAIAIVEILPEIQNLAHVNMLDNADLVKLADARTEEAQEEACALYASLMAATRLSKTIICIDLEVPSEQSGEIVKAMGKQVVAYTLRNMERIPDSEVGAAVASALNECQAERQQYAAGAYPDVLMHLVGRDHDRNDSSDDDTAPDEDYVIGGTGVVKALACCLKNRGDESRRQSGELMREFEDEPQEEATSIRDRLPTGGKAKDMSKQLLSGARKIRIRIQPALAKARANPSDEQILRKLVFFDETLQGIINRFEDEFPDTRETAELASPAESTTVSLEELSPTPTATDDAVAGLSDGDDESKLHPPRLLSHSSSVRSMLLAQEEARSLRAGHKLRSAFVEENMNFLLNVEDIESDPKNAKVIIEMAESVGGEFLETLREKGAVRTFNENRDMIYRCMKAADPVGWDRFVESQQKARANISVPHPIGQNESAVEG